MFWPTKLANSSHHGEVFTPLPVVQRLFELLGKPLKPLYDPCAGLGQFEAVVQIHVVNDLYPENVKFIRDWIPYDAIITCDDALKKQINDVVVVANPPFEDYMEFIQHTFINNESVPLAAFIIPCKWMGRSADITILWPYITTIQLLDDNTFEKTGSRILTRIVSGTCIIILSRTMTDKITVFSVDNTSTIIPRNILITLPILPCRLTDEAFSYIQIFKKYAEIYPIRSRFLSQYHYYVHSGKTSDKLLPEEAIIITSRRQKIAQKVIDRSRFRMNTHYEDTKVLLNTSNECQNGYILAFPVYRVLPRSVFTASFFGFWGTKEEMDVLASFFEMKAVQVLIALVKRTQNFNSSFFWCIPFISTGSLFKEIQKQLQPFTDFINSFDRYPRRPYDTSNFPKY